MRVNKGSMSYLLLEILEKSIDGYVRLEDFAYKSNLYNFSGRWQKPLPKSGLAKAINRLKTNGLIEKITLDQKLIVKLTNEGKQLFIENYKKDFIFDGKWRIVIFDIPEQKRIIRNLFRRNLKKWGFKPLQKSVWINKRDCFEKLNSYIKSLKIEDWVVVLETDKISSLPKY